MPLAIRVIDRAADLADVATPFTDGGFLKWNNSTGKFETARVSHAELADLNGDHHNIYLRTDGTRAMTGRLDFNIASSGVAIRVNEAGVANADITSDGSFWAYPAETSYRVFNVVPKTRGHPTFSVQGTGQISWGDGSSAADVTLYRDQASWLRVGGNLRVDNTLMTGLINSTVTSPAFSSFTPALHTWGFAGLGTVTAFNTHTLVLYGYYYGNHPILMVSAKGWTPDPLAPWDASATARLTVLADGRVGINTTSPSGSLDVSCVSWWGTDYPQIGSFRDPDLPAGSSVWLLVGKSDNVGEGAFFGYRCGATAEEQFAFMGVSGDPVSANGLGVLVRKGGKVLMGTRTAIGHLTVGKPTGGIFDSTTISGFFGNPTGGDNVYFIGNTLNGCYADPANNAELWVNYRGYAGGTTHTRSFVVGDGKGAIVAYFDGDTKRVGIGTVHPKAMLDVVGGCIRCDGGFNVGGTAGFSGTIPAGRDIYVSGGIITGHS